MSQVDGVDEPSRDELVAQVEREWADWEALIARSEATGRLEQPGAAGAWSMKDVVAHMTAYQRFGATLIGGDVRRVEVPPEIGLDTQRRNEWFHEQDRDRSTADVLAEARQVHAEIVRRVRAMSPEELRRHPVDWQPWPAWRWIVHLTHEHYPEHVPNIEAWLSRS
jgi:hypothetical protein